MTDNTNDPHETAQAPGPEPRKKKRRSRAPLPEGFAKGAYVDRSAVFHQARVLAMQSLYEMELVQRPIEDIIERIRHDDSQLPESVTEDVDADESGIDDIPQPVADRAINLVQGVMANMVEIDAAIEKAAPQFPVAQLANVDRNVLRLAIHELQHVPEVPYKVAINEAVEIAKRYGGPNSGKFVNGVLGTISRQLPPERTAGKR